MGTKGKGKQEKEIHIVFNADRLMLRLPLIITILTIAYTLIVSFTKRNVTIDQLCTRIDKLEQKIDLYLQRTEELQLQLEKKSNGMVNKNEFNNLREKVTKMDTRLSILENKYEGSNQN